jgi:pimeloyl-ACP methyl ester carboxylesterase
MKTGYISVNEGKIYYEEKGQGEVIVLLHPGLTDSRMWNNQVNELSKKYRIICYDQRGYGKSDIPLEKYSTNKDLLTLLDSLKIEKANLVGICMGGLHALELVIEYPQRVEKVALSGTAFLNWKFPEYVIKKNIEFSNIVLDGAEKAIETIKTDQFWKQSYPSDNYPEAQKLFLQYLDDNKKAFSVNWQFKKQDFTTIDKVAEINNPVLVIRPEFEMDYVVEIADFLLKNINDSKSVEIEGAGHFANMEKPKRFNEIIIDFLNDK